MILDQICAVARLTPSANNSNKESYQAIPGYEAVGIDIQSASAELTAVTNGAYGTTFTGFVVVDGIQIGDQITVSGGSTYIVKGTNTWSAGPIPHTELVMFLADN